jgi:cubilin
VRCALTIDPADINECLQANGGCDDLSTCTNNNGSFSCGNCPSGYSGSGLKGCHGTIRCCVALPVSAVTIFAADVDECLNNNGGCDKLTVCTNTVGSRDCGACPLGYSGNGIVNCTGKKQYRFMFLV